MKLAKALKVKNKLAGEIANAQRLIEASNVVENENKSPHDVVALLKELEEKQLELADLKAKISIANGPIAGKIFGMAELKARIVFLRSLSTKDGTFNVTTRYGAESTKVTYTAQIKAADVESEVKKLSSAIEQLQDEIDEHNAATSI